MCHKIPLSKPKLRNAYSNLTVRTVSLLGIQYAYKT